MFLSMGNIMRTLFISKSLVTALRGHGVTFNGTEAIDNVLAILPSDDLWAAQRQTNMLLSLFPLKHLKLSVHDNDEEVAERVSRPGDTEVLAGIGEGRSDMLSSVDAVLTADKTLLLFETDTIFDNYQIVERILKAFNNTMHPSEVLTTNVWKSFERVSLFN